jgi:cell division protein FtsI (penicillin-binding protein 3)
MSQTLTKWVRLRLLLVGFFLAILGLVLAGRFFHLQVILGQELREEAEAYIQKLSPVLPVRGLILDRRGIELAVSTRVYSVVAHPRQIKNPDRIAKRLAPVLGMSQKDLMALLTPEKPFVWLKRHLTPEREEAFRAWQEKVQQQKRNAGSPGGPQKQDEDAIYLLPEARRYYPQQALAGPILGFCNIDGKGLEGLEYQFDQELYGKPKKCLRMIDARGHIVTTEEKAWDPEVMGHNLVLTIDRTIQYIAEKELARGVEKWNAAGGYVMVMRPQSGEILAMAQLPTMDPNHPARTPEPYRKNRVLTEALEPGSSFKVFIVASALDAGLVRPTDRYHCENGVWHLGAKEVIHDVHPYGSLTVQQVIQKSSNIGSAKIANKLGGARLDQYLRALGFGSRTGIPFPGETTGLVKNHSRARSPLDRATTAFGQGVSVSVLQLTTALAALGNDGVLMQPLLVKEIVSAKGEKIQEFSPRPVRRVLSSQAAQQILTMMEMVTQQGGTAVGAAPPGFTAAGKTGTAQKVVGRAYSHSKFNSVFMGLVPADKPVLAITVIIDESKGAIYGGVVAAPIFREIAAQALRVLGHYPPTPNMPVLASAPAKANGTAPVQAGFLPVQSIMGGGPETALASSPAKPKEPLKVMPDVRGLTIRQVLDLLHQAGVRCKLDGSGLAVAQDPAPGATLSPGDVCSVKFQSPL